MIQYHAFKNGERNFLYLTKYKQLFLIPDNEYEKLVKPINMNDTNEIISFYESRVNKEDDRIKEDIKNLRYGLFLCIANTCNARCTYCFAHQGDYGKTQGIMESDIAQKAVDAFMQQVPEDGEASIIFFGGEPLMAYDQIVETCEYTKSNYTGKKKFKFHIVTNATLLNKERIDFLAENDFSVAVSIDGDWEVQNRQRPLANGKDSYNEVLKNLDYLLNSIKNTHARGTYCDFNISLPKIYNDLLSIGFKEVNVPPDILNAEMNKDFDKLLKELDALYDYILKYINENDDFPFGLFIEHIRRLFIPKLDIDYGCGLGETIFSVDIKGDVYPCHRYSSDENHKMGNVFDKIEKKIYNYTSKQCQSCWNRYTCSHGCSYNDYEITNSPTNKNTYWCKYSQKMTELSLALCTQLNERQLRQVMLIS